VVNVLFFVIFKRRKKNVKQWRQAYKQHQLSFDNIRKKHINLLFMMDIEKNFEEIFFSFYLWLFFRETI